MLTKDQKSLLREYFQPYFNGRHESSMMHFMVSMNMNKSYQGLESDLAQLSAKLLGDGDSIFTIPGRMSTGSVEKSDARKFFCDYFKEFYSQNSASDSSNNDELNRLNEDNSDTASSDHNAQYERMMGAGRICSENVYRYYPDSTNTSFIGVNQAEYNVPNGSFNESLILHSCYQSRDDFYNRQFEEDLATALDESLKQAEIDARNLRTSAAESRKNSNDCEFGEDGFYYVKEFTPEMNVMGENNSSCCSPEQE